MLSKILTRESCAKCRNCCVFHEESRWETPVVSEEKAELIRKKLHNSESVVLNKNVYSLASVKRDIQLKDNQEIYKCAALDENKGCTLSDEEKPFDCSLWPVRIMEKENRIYIMLAKGCRSVDDTFIDNINTLLSEGLRARIISEMISNPDIIKPFVDGYITICDITEDCIKALLAEKKSDACEDCYLGLYVWRDRYDLRLLKLENGFILHSNRDGSYLFPMPGNKAYAVIKEILEKDEQMVIHRVTVSGKEFLENNFPGVFEFSEDTGSYDYLYEVGQLAELKGKKLSKKRNHINAFLNEHDNWQIEEINENNCELCRDFAKKWYDNRIKILTTDEISENSGTADNSGLNSLMYEKEALFNVLDNLKLLEAEGVLLKADDVVIAFAVGQRISERTYDVVFEKADDAVRGAYNMINREFVRFLRDKYPDLKYINRENDLDLPGLRKAKKSYMPCQMVIKYNAVRK